MDTSHLETDSATFQQEYLVRVQIPPQDTPRLLAAFTRVIPLRYERYERVAPRRQRDKPSAPPNP